MTLQEFLEAFPDFQKMPERVVEKILSAARRMTVPPGHYIYSEGDFCQMFTFLISGEVRVFKMAETGREITLYELGAGDTCIINASCILSGIPTPAFAITLGECDAFLLPAPEFRRLTSEHEELREYIFKVLGQNLSNVMALVEEIAFKHMDERLIEYLEDKSEYRKTLRNAPEDCRRPGHLERGHKPPAEGPGEKRAGRAVQEPDKTD